MLALDSNNNIVHIKDALSQTNYFCDECKGILRVKNGSKKAKHFFHLSENCGSKGESLIHRYWKEYFSKLKEFRGYIIIDSRIEFGLLNNTFFPDVVLKTDKNEYIIIEICYKNPKNIEYLEKFKKLTRFIKVYEIKVDFNKILEIKEIYDKNDYRKLDKAKEKVLKNGSLKYEKINGKQYYVPFFDLRYKNYKKPKKKKIYLSYNCKGIEIKTEPFTINVYNIYIGDCFNDTNEKLGNLYIKDFETENFEISIYTIVDNSV